MLITNLLPLLARYSLGFDLVAGPDDTVTLTVIPRRQEGAAHKLETGETRPISLTASAAEIDAEQGVAGYDPQAAAMHTLRLAAHLSSTARGSSPER